MSKGKIGLFSLTALVLSSMIGSGIFSLPQNMAEVAGAEALLSGWLITGIGIIFLGLSFFFLSRIKPELEGGVYTYAREGFGDLVGGLSAWGYWLCTAIGSVGYLVVAFEGLGAFVDSENHTIFGQGNTLAAILGASVIVWAVHYLIARGIREAAYVNLIATIVKTLPLFLFIGLAVWFFSPEQFVQDFSGVKLGTTQLEQVKGTMLITLWVFVGVEGASVLSAHAKKKSDVGLATILGILITLVLYVAITVLSLGILPREVIAEMPNPSMAGLMEQMIGTSGKIIITFCLIVSVLASYMSWTMFSSEIPYQAAKTKVFPKVLNRTNINGTPIAGLWLTNITIQISLLLVLFTGKGYSMLIQLSTTMILVPYFLVGAYLFKVAMKQNEAWYIKLTGAMASVYGLWIVYAAGLDYLLLSVVLYVPGLALFFYSRKQSGENLNLTRFEKSLLAVISVLFIGAVYTLFTNSF
ncbi:basic amino acid/polyamine antiporter [Actinobacillus pleuropneumoniae]|uniref:Basic amino acid/polyamine antiporter n=6 Tax=Actinobacillus pleuropneumoniae TaxID=715 RepID=A0A9Q4DHV2_ACTPL|nr:basic amino acid/polyamine antiporter [Actinobacillus pleuropneumoniae]ABY69655.1 putative arginine/ornithine antiporter protein [Actinobacillus pleuropneumoniae serovar 3 str. JL03]EFL81386.1 putative arginine/ornithine antiporter protein [Actinobacillus pleuropneumoniae serovar 6 str. Femo]EFM89719.1 Amino acid permease-associated region [Actinobacillus pleuropneumoniae serovar 4 str. M62]EFM91773.1 Amino acid permease-associated region [Actinobacillus pleuropneumoniae serovar 6 str. Femo]